MEEYSKVAQQAGAPARSFQWPGKAPFALFLSHDIDQIYDREMWRILADINHIRRMLFSGERGHLLHAFHRIGRALFRPKPAVKDFETILEIEASHGFRSTFFVLHDRYWARHGARYDLTDPEIHDVANLIKAAGCEIGVHGGYYRFNDAGAYRESRELIRDALGVDPVGIRNHGLRFSGPDTWRAQLDAGFSYDATYGFNERIGPRGGHLHPFWAVQDQAPEGRCLVELPLTVMDGALFRHHKLSGQEALDAAWDAVLHVVQTGGLVSLLWHSNYFNEPEYQDWQQVYERLLSRLAELKPWCATGVGIDRWWRSQQAE